jgi:hypothetical protein
MCFEYYERMQRQDEQRRRESLDEEKRRAEKDFELTQFDQTEWETPEEPAEIREKVPA